MTPIRKSDAQLRWNECRHPLSEWSRRIRAAWNRDLPPVVTVDSISDAVYVALGRHQGAAHGFIRTQVLIEDEPMVNVDWCKCGFASGVEIIP